MNRNKFESIMRDSWGKILSDRNTSDEGNEVEYYSDPSPLQLFFKAFKLSKKYLKTAAVIPFVLFWKAFKTLLHVIFKVIFNRYFFIALILAVLAHFMGLDKLFLSLLDNWRESLGYW